MIRKRILFGLGIGFFTFLIGVGAAVAWFLYDFGPPNEALKEPPCGSTWRNWKDQNKCPALGSSEIPTVAFCDLVRDPDRYKQKVVRTLAKFYSDSGNHGLSDPACSGGGIWVDFDSAYGISAEAQKAFDDFLCARRKYYANKEAEVIVVGRFNGLDGKAGDNYRRSQFVIMGIEQAKNQRLTYVDR